MNKNSSQNQNVNYGKSWKKAGTFNTFEDADVKRINLLKNNDSMQTKVRWRNSQKNYTVLYRELFVEKQKELKQKKKVSGKKKRQKK